MKKIILPILIAISHIVYSQPNNNGQLDRVDEFVTRIEVPFTMPDGVKLMTDLFLPIVRDCMLVHIDDTLLGSPVKGDIVFIQNGTQLVIYDSVNGVKVDDTSRYQLPLILTRTPYDKYPLKGNETINAGAYDAGGFMCLLGYAYAVQDMRGRYKSEGAYFPMYSDSWNKNAYHPQFANVIDITPLSSPHNSNKHEDGYWSIKYITDSLKIPDNFNVASKGRLVCNGSVGMFGASALGNTQLQAAAAHRIDPMKPGLKGLIPIVATNEHADFTAFPNGTFRERIVTGWLKGQIVDLDEAEDILPNVDNDPQNSFHTPADFNLPNRFVVGEKAIDHFTSLRYFGNPCGYYPNSPGKPDMDASRAMVNKDGESVAADGVTPLPDLNYSRYTNMEVPIYHVTGWWDIYSDGQLETFRNSQKYLSDSLGNKNLQKFVIGPWAHQTTLSLKTGDMTYPKGVKDILRFNAEDFDWSTINLNDVLESEIISWYRYTLNQNKFKNIGAPKYIIPESKDWQDLGKTYNIRFPSKDFIMTFEQLFNYLTGTGGLGGMMIELENKSNGDKFEIPLPKDLIKASGKSAIKGVEGKDSISIKVPDFKNKVPNIRFWVCGNDETDIANTGQASGNYWFPAETFPIDWAVNKKKMYMHQNGTLNSEAPTSDEGFSIYVHDPDDPIVTVGGGNMIVRTPDGSRNSQGQMNLADPSVISLTMNRKGVIAFEKEVESDSLCIIGYPVTTLYAKSNPSGTGLTDTEFFVRVLDVYPDGREFFVVEGGVNAKAREYARSIADGKINYDASYSNIEIGKIYEYKFQLMPIAYTFSKGHKVKILISSSNHPRYQSHPNLPTEDGDFFRRFPNDGRGYVFNGKLMYPRKAVQRIAFAPQYPSNIELPVYENSILPLGQEENSPLDGSVDALIFPNPASTSLSIYMNTNARFNAKLYNALGQLVYQSSFQDYLTFNIDHFERGLYVLKIQDEARQKEQITRKVAIN